MEVAVLLDTKAVSEDETPLGVEKVLGVEAFFSKTHRTIIKISTIHPTQYDEQQLLTCCILSPNGYTRFLFCRSANLKFEFEIKVGSIISSDYLIRVNGE